MAVEWPAKLRLNACGRRVCRHATVALHVLCSEARDAPRALPWRRIAGQMVALLSAWRQDGAYWCLRNGVGLLRGALTCSGNARFPNAEGR